MLELSVSGKPLVVGTPPAHFSKNRVKKTTMQAFQEAHTFFAKNNFLSHKAKNLQ